MRKVKTGDPMRIPAAAYNRMVDAARAQRESGTLSRPGAAGAQRRTGIVLAHNASGEAASRRGLCEISDTGETAGQVEFVKPGGAGGVELYGVLVDSIPAGSIGRVAISGGPWDVTYAAGAVGDLLGAQDGAWLANVGEVLKIVRGTVDGVVVCFFVHSWADGGSYEPANSKIVNEVGADSKVIFRDEYNGSWSTVSDSFALYKFDTPVVVSADCHACAYARTYLLPQASCRLGPAVGEVEIKSRFHFAALIEDFDYDTLDRAGLEALTMRERPTMFAASAADKGLTPYATDLEAKGGGGSPTLTLSAMSCDIKPGDTVYGFALYWHDSFYAQVGTAITNAYREMDLSPGLGGTRIPAIAMHVWKSVYTEH